MDMENVKENAKGLIAADIIKLLAKTSEEEKHKNLPLPISVNGEFCIGQDYPVEVKSAGDKGMGVFATKNIKRGDICCYYDGIICTGPYSAILITGEHDFAQQICASDGTHGAMAGFRSQLRHGGCAQMCNDASTTYTNDKDLTYQKNINVQDIHLHDDSGHLCLYFVATKRIKKGEELLYSYGTDYWKSKKLREANSKDKDHSVKSYFELFSNDVIAKLNKDTEKLKMEKSFLTDLQMAYDTKGVGLDDYILRDIITKCLFSKACQACTSRDGV